MEKPFPPLPPSPFPNKRGKLMNPFWPSGIAGIARTAQFTQTFQCLWDASLATVVASFKQGDPPILGPMPVAEQTEQDTHAMDHKRSPQTNPNQFSSQFTCEGFPVGGRSLPTDPQLPPGASQTTTGWRWLCASIMEMKSSWAALWKQVVPKHHHRKERRTLFSTINQSAPRPPCGFRGGQEWQVLSFHPLSLPTSKSSHSSEKSEVNKHVSPNGVHLVWLSSEGSGNSHWVVGIPGTALVTAAGRGSCWNRCHHRLPGPPAQLREGSGQASCSLPFPSCLFKHSSQRSCSGYDSLNYM